MDMNDRIAKGKSSFQDKFGRKPTVAGIAPGRVNLIGEHTDYNEGFVFPMAMPLYTVVVGGPSSSDCGQCRVVTTAENIDQTGLYEFTLPTDDKPLVPSETTAWVNYFLGVVANFHGPLPPFDAVIVSDVPLGGGLSSSASLEVATYSFLEELTGNYVTDAKDKAKACQKAEHDFAHMPCGIMDQLISVMATEKHALRIDCRSLDCEQVPVTDPDVSLVVCNSNVRHTLSGSEYPSRRSDCHNTAKTLNKKSLREATMEQLQASKADISAVAFKRARHVISENIRVEDAVTALKKNDYNQLGQLMLQSHYSLKDDFEVSCSELDELVSLAMNVEGVFGARMTGGGFGGCVVILVKKNKVDALKTSIRTGYSGTPTFYVCTPSKGTHSVKL